MILDFHTHAFPDELAWRALDSMVRESPGLRPCTDGTAGGLLESMHEAGINRAVTLPVATRPSQVRAINQTAADQAADALIPFGALHPAMPLDEIEREISFLAERRIRGVKFHPEYQNFHVDSRRMYPVYERLRQAGLIAVFHAGKDPGPFSCDHALPGALLRIVHDFPGLRLVAAHMGGWQLWEEAARTLAGKPLFFDTAAVSDWLPPAAFIAMTSRHGAENILFGTDSPWYDQKRERNWIDALSLCDTDKELILGGNAQRLLGPEA